MNIFSIRTHNNLYKVIKRAYVACDNIKILWAHQNDHDIYNKFSQVLKDTVSLDFTFAIKYLDKCKNIYKMSCQDVKFFIFSSGFLKNKEKIKLEKCMKRILITKMVYNIHKPMNFYILMNPVKRYLPKKGIINTCHINGGFTNIHKNDIFIVRKEEYEKVMLHELLHHQTDINIDDWKPNNIQLLKDKFQIHDSCNVYPNEAVVETFACVLNVIFYALEENKQYTNMLKDDIKHSENVCKKIICYQNSKKWNEKTNTFCYTIFKTIFYKNFNKFITVFKYNFQGYNDTGLTLFLITNHVKQKTGTILNDRKLKLTCFDL
jgi:hypothetical protein